VPLITHPEAERLLRDYYGDQVTDTRLRMARVPEGATLIANPVSVAPGFQSENVYVMAGVPKIFSAMLDGVVATLKAGQPIVMRAVSAYAPESLFAEALGNIQKQYPDVDLGSYPQIHQGRIGTTIVARGTEVVRLDAAISAVRAMMQAEQKEVLEGEFLLTP
jgi:molybdopterin-biosynthesis enzyme MoeA-like protein